MADAQFCSLDTDNLLALLDTHERLIAASEAELFAEFLLGSDVRLIAERWRRQKEVLEDIGWRTLAELFDLARQGDRNLGVYMIISAADRSAKVKALTQVRTESLDRLSSLPALASTLQERGIPAVEYLRAVEEHASESEPLLVLETDVAASPVMAKMGEFGAAVSHSQFTKKLVKLITDDKISPAAKDGLKA